MNRKKSSKEFSLAQNEEYSERCGEVFLTNIGNLVFHCTLCDMKCKGFEKFADHIRDEHLLCSSPHYDYFNFDPSELNIDCDYDNESFKEEDIMSEGEPETRFDFEVIDNKDDYIIEDVFQSNIGNEMEVYSLNEEDDTISTDNVQEIRNFQSVNNRIEAISKNNVKPEKVDTIRKSNSLLDVLESTEEIRTIRTPMHSTVFDANRKYKCPLCSAAFKDKNNLKHHIRRHSNVKNFPCEHCEKKFYTRAELKVHLRSHTQERPFLCCECGLRFATNVIFLMHMKKHRNERDIHCPHCDATFYQKERLKTHLAQHNNEFQHVCDVCKCRFEKRRSLLRHLHVHIKRATPSSQISDEDEFIEIPENELND